MDVQCMELFVNKKSERCRRQLYTLRAAFGVVRKRQVKVMRCLGCLKRYKEKKKNKQTNKKEQQNNQKRREKKVRRRREERRKEIKRDGQTFLFIHRACSDRCVCDGYEFFFGFFGFQANERITSLPCFSQHFSVASLNLYCRPYHLSCPASHMRVLVHRLPSPPKTPRKTCSVKSKVKPTAKWQYTKFTIFCPVTSSLLTPSSTFFPSLIGLYPATLSFDPSSSPLPRTLNNCVHPPFPSLLFFVFCWYCRPFFLS